MATTSRSSTAIGIGALIVLGGAVLLGSWAFVRDVQQDRSPRTLAWVAAGFLIFSVAVLVVSGIGKLLKVDDDRLTGVSAVVALVAVAAGLGWAHYAVNVRQSPLAATLAPACRGDAVPRAAGATGGDRKVVVLDVAGKETRWTHRDASWRADKVGDASLVACVGRQDVSLEVCQYAGVASPRHTFVERFAEVVTVRLVVARTGKNLAEFELRAEPRACRKVEVEGRGNLHGRVSFAAFEDEVVRRIG